MGFLSFVLCSVWNMEKFLAADAVCAISIINDFTQPSLLAASTFLWY
jgi:hypothetical protein